MGDNVKALAFLLAGTGAILIGLGAAMWARRLRPNNFAGYRTRAAMASNEAWYAANAAVGPIVLALGIVQVVTSLVFLSWSADGDRDISTGIGITVAISFALLGVGLVVGEKAAREVGK